MAIRLVVFDLDGTLVDSRRDLGDSVNALLVELGAQPLELDAVTAMVGEGAAVLVKRALAAAGLSPDSPAALERFLAHYDLRLTTHTRPYVGIPEALDTMRSDGEKLAVLTNKPQQPTKTILQRLGLIGWFSQVVGGDTDAGRKPDPAGLLSIASAVRATPQETVLVGDSAIDLQTAHRAGCGICLARWGFGLQLDDTPLRGDEVFIGDPLELPDAIKSFRSNTPAAPAPGTSQSHT